MFITVGHINLVKAMLASELLYIPSIWTRRNLYGVCVHKRAGQRMANRYTLGIDTYVKCSRPTDRHRNGRATRHNAPGVTESSLRNHESLSIVATCSLSVACPRPRSNKARNVAADHKVRHRDARALKQLINYYISNCIFGKHPARDGFAFWTLALSG